MAEKPQEAAQRWTAKRRVALVVSIIKGDLGARSGAQARLKVVA